MSGTSPVVFLLAYLALVPVFAVLYTFVPNGFYAPYGKYERDSATERQVIASFLQDEVRRNLRARKQAEAAAFAEVDDAADIIDSELLDDRTLQFLLAVVLRNGQRADARKAFLQFTLSEDSQVALDPGDPRARLYRQVKLAEKGEKVLAAGVSRETALSLFRKLFSYDDGLPFSVVRVSDAQNQRIDRFFYGVYGASNVVNGTFWRMLYFSTVTITTVGFGDVVPMTDLARMVVCLELLLGVTTAGLFLNALVHRFSRPGVG